MRWVFTDESGVAVADGVRGTAAGGTDDVAGLGGAAAVLDVGKAGSTADVEGAVRNDTERVAAVEGTDSSKGVGDKS